MTSQTPHERALEAAEKAYSDMVQRRVDNKISPVFGLTEVLDSSVKAYLRALLQDEGVKENVANAIGTAFNIGEKPDNFMDWIDEAQAALLALGKVGE